MKIQVLGTGCPKCNELASRVGDAVSEAGLDCEVEKVTDIVKITEAGVMMTPALVVDGEVKAAGKLPSVEQIKGMLA